MAKVIGRGLPPFSVSSSSATWPEGRLPKGRSAVRMSSLDRGLWVVCRRRLLDIKGLAVRLRFDPDRRPQSMVLLAVNRHGRELRFEIHDPLECRGGPYDASARIVLHEASLVPRPQTTVCKTVQPYARLSRYTDGAL